MKFKIHYLFIIFSIYLIIIGNFFAFIQYLICIILHEYAHAFVALKRGYKLDAITLMPYGAGLNFKDQIYSENDEIIIALAGPIFNLLMCVIMLAIWWIFPATYSYLYLFFMANFWTFIFNLLPAYPLDGGRVLSGLLSKKFSRNSVGKIIRIFNLILGLSFLIFFIISCLYGLSNFTILSASFFLLSTLFEKKQNGVYQNKLLLLLGNPITKPKKVNLIAVSGDVSILDVCKSCKVDCYNMIYFVYPSGKVKALSESQLRSLLLVNNPQKQLRDFLGIEKF